MADLNLQGTLNLQGLLRLNPAGGKLTVGRVEALVEVLPTETPHSTSAPPVIQPPPPAAPTDPGTTVYVINSLNKSVTVGGRNIVTQGMVLQGNVPTWPGMVLPSIQNATVTINRIPINVVGDQAMVFPPGGLAVLSNSGQR